MTEAEYTALLDRLLQAVTLEAEKAAQGEAAMARWARVAVPRFQALSALVGEAEAATPEATAAWFATWQAAQERAGRWPFEAAGGEVQTCPGAGGWP